MKRVQGSVPFIIMINNGGEFVISLVELKKREFDSAFSIMEEAFPSTEIRTYDGQKDLFEDEFYHLYGVIKEPNKVLAIVAIWDLNHFLFIEHLAVNKLYRNEGLGAQILQNIKKQWKKNILLEVEPPITMQSKRRVDFYERQEFYRNDYPYEQPPLRVGNPEIPLQIMTYPTKISEKEFKDYKKILYKVVYKI